MDGRAVPSENSHFANRPEERNAAALQEAGNVVHNHITVNQVKRAGNTILGDIYGIVNQQCVSIDEAGLNQLLEPILDASHRRDRERSPPNSECFPGTRTGVIRRIVAWADSTLLWNTHVLWLYGYVGCGKSAIALAIALKFEQRNRLVGSFFFFRNTGDRSRMIKFATTLACQLAAAIPGAAPFIRKAVKEEPGLLKSSLVAQLRRLVYEPFKAAVMQGVSLLTTSLLNRSFLVVIDGLDECEDRQDVQAFIDDMLDFFKKNPFVPLRFLITSRVEQHIQGHLKNDQVRLENLVNHCSRDDMDTFMRICFEEEKKRNPVIMAYIQENGDWPTTVDKDTLVDHIDGSFIFASALFKYIVDPTDDRSTPMERLPHTLQMNPGLDTLYSRTLSRSQHLPRFSDIISTLALLQEPLSIVGIAELLGMQSFEVVRVLVNLQAIIHIPGTDEMPVTFCHTSLRDFLTSESRSGLFFAPPLHHLLLSYCCFVLRDKKGSQAAANSYSIAYFEEHFEKFVRFHPNQRMPAPHPPGWDLVPTPILSFDILYNQILARSQDIPIFSDIISTIALLNEPLTVVSIAELLEIKAPEVSQVLDNLEVIVNNPGIGKGAPVTMRHSSLRDFLTTETRSGPYFIPPSYHLKLSFRCFDLDFRCLVVGMHTPGDYFKRCGSLRTRFLNEDPERTILDELEQLTPTNSQSLQSHHFFSFGLLFFWIFDSSNSKTGQFVHFLTKCVESLALAMECDPTPGKWLQQHFGGIGFYGYRPTSGGIDITSTICQEQFEALQHNIQRIGTAIRKKCSCMLSDANSDIDRFGVDNLGLDNWKPMEAY